MIPFSEWLPDMADLNNPGSRIAKNVFPHAMGFAPMPSAQTYGDALGAHCRGATYARDKSDVIYVYGGEETKLQVIADAAWSDVTRSGDAYASGANERWEFAQWDQKVVATNYTDEVQVITLGGANFADLAGTPPLAKHLAVARNFLILGYCNDVGGDGVVPNRVHWSGLNDIETWASSAVTQSDYEDLKGNGGFVQRIFGGEYAVVFQEQTTWRMSYVGAPAVWQFDEVAPDVGLVARGMAARVGNSVYFLSQRGFHVLRNGSQADAIGDHKIDDFVLNDLDTDNLHRCEAIADNKNNRVLFVYPGDSNISGLPNRMVVYDYALNRWSYSEQDTEALVVAATSGYTMDGLDSVNTDLDAIDITLDSSVWTGGRAAMAKVDSSHKLAFFTGSPMDATLETGEVQLSKERRTLLSDVRPLVDGGTTTIQVGTRDVQSADRTWTVAAPTNGNGRANVRKNARYFSVRANISGEWTHAQGVEMEGSPAGWR